MKRSRNRKRRWSQGEILLRPFVDSAYWNKGRKAADEKEKKTDSCGMFKHGAGGVRVWDFLTGTGSWSSVENRTDIGGNIRAEHNSGSRGCDRPYSPFAE